MMDIEKLAREAGFRLRQSTFGGHYIPGAESKTKYDNCLFNGAPPPDYNDLMPELRRFAALVAEACAEVCEELNGTFEPSECAAAIRERFKAS